MAHPELGPHPIDLTHTDGYAKAAFQFTLDTARSNLWVGGAELAEPRSRWFDQFVWMAVAIIQKSRPDFVFGTRQLSEAVSRGARNGQLALGHRCLPGVACEHVLDEL